MSGRNSPGGYEPPYEDYDRGGRGGSGGGGGGGRSGGGGLDGGGSSMAAVAQLFARLSQEIEEQKPKNCIHFIVDFLCKHYPEHLHGFASIWQMDPDLERERHEVVNFFKAHKISTAVAAHFTNAGYDTLDTLTTLNKESLVDVEAFNNVKWLPGHKVRLQQIFGEIAARVRAYRQQYNGTGGRARAGVVAPRQVASIRDDLFSRLDRDGDGMLSRAEMAAFPSAMAAPAALPWAPPAPPVYLPRASMGTALGAISYPAAGGLQYGGGFSGGQFGGPLALPAATGGYGLPLGCGGGLQQPAGLLGHMRQDMPNPYS